VTTVIDPAALRARLDRLGEGGETLRRIPLEERIAIIDRVAAQWREPGSPWRRQALAALSRTTGHAAAAIEYALDHLWAALTTPELTAVASRELGPEAGAPERLAFHSLAGNVPGAGAFGVIAALLAGVPSVVKTARHEPELPALVATSIAAADPRFGAALVVAHWPGGSEAHEALVVERSSVVLAYGRAATLERLAARAPRRLLRFGPRLSVALVAREAADAATVAAAAQQAALFDQHGCLSPQYLVLEETDADATAAFVDALAASFRRLAQTMPRAPLTLDEAAHVWRFVERARWRAQEGAAIRVVADGDAGFGVICDRTRALDGSPLQRHLVLLPVDTLADTSTLLAPLVGSVEAVGVAAPAARWPDAAAVAASCGAHRLCPLERMQAPPFAWRQSGHARLASLLVPESRDRPTGDAPRAALLGHGPVWDESAVVAHAGAPSGSRSPAPYPRSA